MFFVDEIVVVGLVMRSFLILLVLTESVSDESVTFEDDRNDDDTDADADDDDEDDDDDAEVDDEPRAECKPRGDSF